MRLLIFIICCLFLVTCSKKVSNKTISKSEDVTAYGKKLPKVQLTKREKIMLKPRCKDQEVYKDYITKFGLHDDRILRVNFHIMNSRDKSQNITGEKAKKWIHSLVKNANKRLYENHKMNLPDGNDTPQYFPGYQYQITTTKGRESDQGIYFHYDDELYYFMNKGKKKNNYNNDVIKKYAIDDDRVLNVFLMPAPKDSVISKSFNPPTTGIALGKSIKISGPIGPDPKPWKFATLLNHEIGHVLGLQHSWISHDGCDDTPKHANCWGQSDKPPCDGATSNNVMDYNGSQMAFSPCQIGIMKKNIAKPDSKQRDLFVESWCDYDPEYVIEIEGDEVWNGAADINKDINIPNGASLRIGCRLSLAKGASIVVAAGGKLILDEATLHNACGDKWKGIQLLTEGNKEGLVEYVGIVDIRDVE